MFIINTVSYSLPAFRSLDKSVTKKIVFLISQPKHMLWVLKITVSMRWFFWASETNIKPDG